MIRILLIIFYFLIFSALFSFVSAQENSSCPKSRINFDDLTFFSISKSYKLSKNYIPNDLVDISTKIKTNGIVCLRKETAENLQNLINDAGKDKIYLMIISGFRDYKTQEIVFEKWKSVFVKNYQNFSAPPGASEHQLGTAIDFGIYPSRQSLTLDFAKTPAAKWLNENSYKYGFVLSYPYGKMQLTTYDYEPWHFRYVGEKYAKFIKEWDIPVNIFLNARLILEIINILNISN